MANAADNPSDSTGTFAPGTPPAEMEPAPAKGSDLAHPLDRPSEQSLCATLRNLGVVDAASTPRLEPVPRNPERRDYLTRASFLVFADTRAVCHLTVGKDLSELQTRTRAFAEACPDIACRPLFWHQSAGWDYLGIELFEGKNLETLVLEGQLRSEDAIARVAKIMSALERTLLPSDVGAAARELDQFFARVCASPIFSGLDQQFLQSVIFPFIRSGALSGPQHTRWTNGDLIARNVLADSHGAVRLVDYEFACRTHFFAEDRWRWRSLSMLPPEALDLPGSHAMASAEPWLEAFFILRHAVLIHEINGAAVAVSGLRQQIDQLVALAAAAHAGFRASVFLQPLALRAQGQAEAPAQGSAMAQLYWGADESYTEDRSQRVSYPVDEDARLSFVLRSVPAHLHLRFDPAAAPGILTISGIRVRPKENNAPLLVLDKTTGWEALRLGSGLLRFGDSQALNLLSLNRDPCLLLPEIAAGDAPRDLVCEVWLRFSRELTALPEILRPLVQARQNLAAYEAALQNERRKVTAARWHRILLDKQLSETQAKLQASQERLPPLQQQVERLTAQIQQREEKIARMQQSFSWRATAPLRWSRRKLMDRPGQPSPPKPLQTLSGIDIPSIWDAAPASGEIVGWCLYPDGRPVGGIRARIGQDAILAGTYGLDREDVAKAHRFTRPDSRACGFRIEYQLPVETTHPVSLEVLGDDNQWHPSAEHTLHTSAKPRTAHDYTEWIETFDTPTAERIAILRNRLAAVDEKAQPLISVLMPVFNTPERWLDRAIASVVAQVYPRWELCIADDASTAPHVRRAIESWQSKDSRIRTVFRETNGHISAASNSALELARGEFVALLDHDDELAPGALAEVVLCLNAHPGTDLVFSDEDKIDEDGRRFDPYFKPNFLPDLLLGQNCISHLSVYRTASVHAVGGFRTDYEGSQDWDLALRFLEKIDPDRIRHVPKILYHWRAIAGSTAREATAKNYAIDSARQALADHFRRCALPAEIRPAPGARWRIVFPLPASPPLVSIIIPTRNRADLVQLCLASIFSRTSYAPYEIILVDNGSDDPAVVDFFASLEREDGVRVLRYDQPFNFSAINNFAVQHARGEVLCFLNNDVEAVNEHWLDELVRQALRPEIGAVGAKLFYPDGRIQHAGVILGLGGVANHAFTLYPHDSDGYFNRARLIQNYSAVTGACLAVRKQVFIQAGGFNETDLSVAFNDIDFCLRVRAAGYRNLWTPFAELIHSESVSRGKEDTSGRQQRFAREVDYMRRTWGPLLDADPAYNPNLALSLRGFELAWPPRSQEP